MYTFVSIAIIIIILRRLLHNHMMQDGFSAIFYTVTQSHCTTFYNNFLNAISNSRNTRAVKSLYIFTSRFRVALKLNSMELVLADNNLSLRANVPLTSTSHNNDRIHSRFDTSTHATMPSAYRVQSTTTIVPVVEAHNKAVTESKLSKRSNCKLKQSLFV